MLNNEPITIIDTNLSRAWARAFLRAATPRVTEIDKLIVTITDFVDQPDEIEAIRTRLDAALRKNNQYTCQTVANTIFPSSQWNSQKNRAELFRRYLRILPELKRSDARNRHGLYFERLIAFGEGRFNQLDHIIATYQRGNHRRSALLATVFDPLTDHTHQRQRGFPCLQQVNFLPYGDRELEVVSFYTKQHLFEKAYGNYLGLCRLGQFMAHEMGLRLTKMTCMSLVATCSDPRRQNLAELVNQITTSVQAADLDAVPTIAV